MNNGTGIRSIYECRECGEIFGCKPSLLAHIMDNHDGRVYAWKYNKPEFEHSVYCEECDKQFRSIRGLSCHVSKKHDAEKYYHDYINTDPINGTCHNPTCNNKTTFRGILYGNPDPNEFGYGYDHYCCIQCAHSHDESKFHTEGHGYYQRTETRQATAQAILKKHDFYSRKRVKYLPESEYLICLELEKLGMDFIWQKSVGLSNVDYFFASVNLCVEMYEPDHYCACKITKDAKRKKEILSTDPNLNWIDLPIKKGTSLPEIVTAIQSVIAILSQSQI